LRRIATIAAIAATLSAVALGGCSESAPEDEATETTLPATTEECLGDALIDCARESTIGAFVPEEPTAATGEPITLGMVNQENTAAGSYPELSGAVEAAVAFINENLGGVGGRPIEVEVCNTEFSTEGSTTCGQGFVEDETPAVLGGIDVFGNAIDTLGDNGIPYIGGIPVSAQSVEAENSFQWSGGTWGATVAFADHAANVLGAESVAIVYGEFGSITDSAQVAAKVLEDADVEVQLVPYPIMATDISSALNAAAAGEPDAMFIMAADSGCKAGFDGLAALGTQATKYFVGACAAPSIIEEVGAEKTNGTIFNVEGPIGASNPSPDFAFYAGVIEEYGEDGLDPIGAGTVTFRSFMNLYAIMSELAADGTEITAETITEALRAKKDAPSFAGHPYTCDGEQFVGKPAMCSPQQILGEMNDKELTQIGDWIDVGAIYQG
jgi:branched-chain amino acid transport system substrate-binding protein